MNLRVVHLITQLELGGAQQNTLYTLGHLNAESFEPILITGPGGLLDEDAKQGTYTTIFVPSLVRRVSPIKDTAALIGIYKLLRKLRPHIIHTHSSKAGIVGRLAAYVAGVPVIIHTFHGFGFTPSQPKAVRHFYIALERFCARLSSHLIFVSRDNMEEARALGLVGNKPCSLIRSGISVQETVAWSPIREELMIPIQDWVVTSVGNFKPQKNPMDLVKVAKSALAQDPNLHFIFVGDGELRPEVEAAARSEGIAEKVHFLGWRKDVSGILAASNCFLLTSLWEGLPRSLAEAGVARLPSVAYAVNGVRDILVENETGFPIAAHDFAAAAEKLVWLKNNPIDARNFGRNARARIENEFNIDKMVREQENLYQALYQVVPLREFYEPLWANPTKP